MTPPLGEGQPPVGDGVGHGCDGQGGDVGREGGPPVDPAPFGAQGVLGFVDNGDLPAVTTASVSSGGSAAADRNRTDRHRVN